MLLFDQNSEIEMGGTGDPPVPSGHWPDGMTGRRHWKRVRKKFCVLFLIPSGGSPLGTGGLPVLPDGFAADNSEFKFNQRETKIPAHFNL